jgi:hypothetical protein
MNVRSSLPLPVAAAVLVVLAGCLGGTGTTGETPTPQQEFVLRIENGADESFTTTVHLLTDLDGVVVQYEGGRTEEFPDATAPGDLPEGALDGAVRVDPVGNVSGVTAFTGPNGDVTVTTPHEGRPRLAFYVVSTPGEDPPADDDGGREIPTGEVRAWNLVTCPDGSTIDSLSLRITPDAASPSFGCDF